MFNLCSVIDYNTEFINLMSRNNYFYDKNFSRRGVKLWNSYDKQTTNKFCMFIWKLVTVTFEELDASVSSVFKTGGKIGKNTKYY